MSLNVTISGSFALISVVNLVILLYLIYLNVFVFSFNENYIGIMLKLTIFTKAVLFLKENSVAYILNLNKLVEFVIANFTAAK